VRAAEPRDGWERWRGVRGELFATHPQSPRVGAEPRYFDYDPAWRFTAMLEPAEREPILIGSSGDEPVRFERFARASFGEHTLDVYWLDAYGGGVFVPFADATSGRETYGAGRYLLDTVKGADLGSDERSLVLDFNFAYNPSCAYDPRWACPLAPPANRLQVEVRAGELTS